MRKSVIPVVALATGLVLLLGTASAQAGAPMPQAAGGAAPAPQARPAPPPPVLSPEVMADRRVVFRLSAPKAQAVTLNAGDIPAGSPPPAFTKNDAGVWEATVGPVPAGAFRYVFVVDGVRTLDPVNTRTSESNTAMWSLFDVAGAEVQDARSVPHGAVAGIFYRSSVLQRMRRMHIYTPPGYEAGRGKYPVFYLLHGSGDTDDAWTSVGRAGFILDNLIASGKAVPMIVVMPAGHQPPLPGTTGAPAAAAGSAAAGAAPAAGSPAPPSVNPFTQEFLTDVQPYIEAHYRIKGDRASRAIAGLSMGGSQTLDIAFRRLAQFAWIGVFSSGATLGAPRPAQPAPGAAQPAAGGATASPAAPPQPPRPDWEAVHLADLDNGSLKKGTKLVWLSTGVDDRLIASTRATVELLKKHGFSPVFKESAGAHTWLNWRDYLIEFAPQLFR